MNYVRNGKPARASGTVQSFRCEPVAKRFCGTLSYQLVAYSKSSISLSKGKTPVFHSVAEV